MRETRHREPGPLQELPRSRSWPRVFRGAAGVLMLVVLGACSTTFADCFDTSTTRLSSRGTEAHLPPGCAVTGNGPNGVANLTCEGGRQGFMISAEQK